MNYDELLKKAQEQMPKSVDRKERFEIPKVTGRIQGNSTVITNFNLIKQKFNRDAQAITKFLLKELAAPGQLKGTELVFGRKISPALINEKVEKFAKTYVICQSCGKPDTQITVESNITYLKCNACGQKHVIKSLV